MIRTRHLIDKKHNEELVEVSCTPNALVYISNCSASTFSLVSSCSKIFIEDCTDVILRIEGKVLAGTLDLLRTTNSTIVVQTAVQTVQIDQSSHIDLQFPNSEDFYSVVVCASEAVKITCGEHVHEAQAQEQAIVRRQKERWTQDVVVRGKGGYATTETEERAFDKRQVANFEKLLSLKQQRVD